MVLARKMAGLVLVSLTVLGFYPILIMVSLFIDHFIGDGSVSLYLMEVKVFRPSLREIAGIWIESLPLALGVSVCILIVLFLIRKITGQSPGWITIPIMGLAIGTVLGLFLGLGQISVLVFALTGLILMIVLSVIMRLVITSKMEQ